LVQWEGRGKRKIGMMEFWKTGKVDYWKIAILEKWKIGTMEAWSNRREDANALSHHSIIPVIHYSRVLLFFRR
jgi:hypothetical protein